MTIAGDRRNVGRSGSDLLAAIVTLVVATQLRAVIAAFWLGLAVTWGLGGRALVQLLQGTLTVDLGVLVIAAAIIFAGSGRRREVGRSFDLACVAVLPLVYLQLVVLVLAHFTELALPAAAVYAPALAWTGSLVALATVEGRRPSAAAPVIPKSSWLAGLAFALVAAAGGWWQVAWIARHVDYVRPLTAGYAAPAFALPAIGATGELGAPVTLESARGKFVIVDFWATWCQPCLQSMPHLDALARKHPDVVVLAVNMDNAKAARKIFDTEHYTMSLVADDGDASERYNVSAIPHTVLIDRNGTVVAVSRGGDVDLDAAIGHLQ